MKNLIMILAAMTALVGHAQSVMASKKYVDTVKSELQAEMMKFPYFDGTPNAMRVSPNPNLGGGFKYVDVNDDNQEMGMAFGPWNASHRAFALWDAGAFYGCDRNDPYFGISAYGLTIPASNSQYPTWTAPWANLVRALNITDSIDTSRNYPVSSLAVVDYTTSAVPSIVTNEVTVGFTEWRFSCDVPEVQSLWDTNPPVIFYADGAGLPVWVIEEVAVPDGWSAYSGSTEGDRDAETVVFYDFLSGPDRLFNIVATRKRIIRNALGLARLKDIEPLLSYEAKVTNVVRKVVHATGRYVWDKDLSVCYRFNAQNGFLDLVAVTNIDVTLPENYLALDAIEKEWSNK